MKQNQLKLQALVWKEGNGWVAKCLNVEVASQGDTKKEAIAMLKEALELYFEDGSEIELMPVEKADILDLRLNLSHA